MKKRFKRLFVSVVMICMTTGYVVNIHAQQPGGDLAGALQEARAAGIPESALNRLLALGYEKQFESSAMGNLLSVLAQCRRENLPLQPFLNKIDEGISKNVPAPRIEQVLVRKLDDYRFTRTLIDEVTKRQGKTDVDFTEYHVRLTETLYCGLSRQDLERLVDQSPAPSLPVLTRGAEVLASLRQIQFDPSLSEQMVDAGLKQGFFTSEQRNFSRVMATAKEKGLPDGQIATAALAVINVRGTVSELASQLGIADQEFGRQGPQVGVGRSGSTSKGKDGAGSPGSGRAASSGRDRGGGRCREGWLSARP